MRPTRSTRRPREADAHGYSQRQQRAFYRLDVRPVGAAFAELVREARQRDRERLATGTAPAATQYRTEREQAIAAGVIVPNAEPIDDDGEEGDAA